MGGYETISESTGTELRGINTDIQIRTHELLAEAVKANFTLKGIESQFDKMVVPSYYPDNQGGASDFNLNADDQTAILGVLAKLGETNPTFTYISTQSCPE